jgi:hypothetical protein
MPALLINISSLPNCLSTEFTASSHPETLLTSPTAGVKMGNSLIVELTEPSVRPFIATEAPSLENASAIARQIPRVPPVTKTTFPSNLAFFSSNN